MGSRARRRVMDRLMVTRWPEGAQVPPGSRGRVRAARAREEQRDRRRVVPTEPRERR